MKKIVTAIIFSIFFTGASYAEPVPEAFAEFTGESFFTPPAVREAQADENKKDRKSTMPPLKRARLKIKNAMYDRAQQKTQLAPTNPEETYYNQNSSTTDFASKELKEDFDENIMPDGFEADEQSVQEHKRAKFFGGLKQKKETPAENENNENIILDCDNMDYDTDKYCLYARGNVNVEFVKQGTVVKADTITYDRMNNTIKAEGNVYVLKNGQTVKGDYIFVDMNEENALIENPVAETATVEIKAKKGYVYGDKIVEESGSIVIDKDFPIHLASSKGGPQRTAVLYPKEQLLQSDIDKKLIKVEAKEIQITEKGNLETLRIKRLKVKKGKYTILKLPAIKFYTNKNNDFVETNIWEIGSRRGLGMYVGPGFVFELPKGSVLKAIPTLNFKSGIGVGALTRFSSGTNQTQAGYGTAGKKFVVHGKQKLDDNLQLHYAVNDYIDEWFLGGRRPKYGANLVYQKGYSSNSFLLRNRDSSFTHRAEFGYFHDIDEDKHYRSLNGGNMGTIRTRYMMEATQNFINYSDSDKLKAFSFDIVGQFSGALYGTGDTQFIGRIGPRASMQYKRWTQQIGYFQSVFDDHTPVPVFDAYRYGKSNLYAREYFRINRYLTVCWFMSLNLSHDSPNNRTFQENAFYVSVGPDDFKVNVGYDAIRETTFLTFEVLMDAKGTRVDYDKLEIKQDKKAKKDTEPVDKAAQNEFKNSDRAPVLQKAIVEDVSTVEDVL